MTTKKIYVVRHMTTYEDAPEFTHDECLAAFDDKNRAYCYVLDHIDTVVRELEADYGDSCCEHFIEDPYEYFRDFTRYFTYDHQSLHLYIDEIEMIEN